MVSSNLQPEEVAEDLLALAEQYAAIEEAAGAWTDEHHPELQSEEDIDRWLAQLRASWVVPTLLQA